MNGLAYAAFRVGVALDAGLLTITRQTEDKPPMYNCEVFSYLEGRVDNAVEVVLVRMMILTAILILDRRLAHSNDVFVSWSPGSSRLARPGTPARAAKLGPPLRGGIIG